MGKPGVKNELAQMKTLQLSCRAPVPQAGQAAAPQPAAPQPTAPQPAALQPAARGGGGGAAAAATRPLLHHRITTPTPAWTQHPGAELSRLSGSSPGSQVGRKPPGLVEPNRMLRATAGEWGRHPPNPPGDMPTRYRTVRPTEEVLKLCLGNPRGKTPEREIRATDQRRSHTRTVC